MIAAAHKSFKQAEEYDPNCVIEKRDLYVSSAKAYFNGAKSISDKTMQASLVYLASLSIHKAEEIDASIPTQSINVTQIPRPEQIDSISGRLTSFDRNTLASRTDTSPPPEKSFKHHANDLVTDLLILENKLNEIGLMKSDLRTIRRVANMTDSTITGNRKSDIGSDNNKEIPLAGNSSYSRLLSNLGESFMILSTTNTTLRSAIESASQREIQRSVNSDYSMPPPPATDAAVLNGLNDKSTTSIYESNPYGNEKKPVTESSIPADGIAGMVGLFGGLSWGLNHIDKQQHTPTLQILRNTPSIGELNMGYMPQFSTNDDTDSGTTHRPVSLDMTSRRPSAATDPPILENPTNSKETASVASSAYGITSLAALDMTSESNRVNCQTGTSQLSDSLASEIRELLTQPSSESTSYAPNHKMNVRQSSYPVDQSAGILKLLDTIKTLSNENAKLEDRLKHLNLVEQQNFVLRREMDNFKADYIHRFAKLKQSLNEFAELHPHPANPANAYACKVSPASISVHSLGSGAGSPSLLDDKIVVSANNEGGDVPNNSLNLSDPEMRQTQLEITVRGLLARLEATTASLEQAKIETEKKSRLVTKYEAYYKELRKSVEKREQERKSSTKTATTNSTPISGASNLGHTQSTKATKEPQAAVGANSNANQGQGSDSEPPPSLTPATTTAPNQSILPANSLPRLAVISNPSASTAPTTTFAQVPITALTNAALVPRHKNPTTSTLEASLQRSAALEKKDRRR